MPRAAKSAVPEDGLTREERTRREITRVTRVLIDRYGFEKLTLDDIAAELGKKKSFLYYYYPDKEAILAATVEAELVDIRRCIDEALPQDVSGLEKVRAYVLLTHHESQRRLPLMEKVRKEIFLGHHDTVGFLFETSSRLIRSNLSRLEILLHEGTEDGSIRPLEDEEITALAHFILLMLQGLEFSYILGEPCENADRDIRIAFNTVEHGLGTRG